MKILLYTYDIMKIGGIETSFYNLAIYLKELGHEVGVRYSVISPMQLEKYKEAGIDIKIIKQEYCDVLFIGSIWRQPQLIISRVTVQQCHADWSDSFWNGAGSALQMIHRADKQVDLYMAVSESSARFVRKASKKEVLVMNNLAPKKQKIAKKKQVNVVFAAFTRMTLEKGLENYQSFREHVKSLGIKAEFRVYTNGDAPEGWKAYEPVPDITKEFSDIDFVCSLSDTESFGYTIAEANSCGIPCIIKRTNSTKEFFSHENNVILNDVTEFTKQDLKTKVKSYTLRETTEQSIKDALNILEDIKSCKCIIKVVRSFTDLQSGKPRKLFEIFSVDKARAKELLANEYKIVERI